LNWFTAAGCDRISSDSGACDSDLTARTECTFADSATARIRTGTARNDAIASMAIPLVSLRTTENRPRSGLIRIAWAATAALFALLIVPSAFGQVASDVLEGQVTDPSGALIPEAAVHLTGPDGAVRNVMTDTAGRYRFAALAPGTYSLRIVSQGFSPFERTNITVASGVTQTVNAQLEIEQPTQQITVAGEGQQLGVSASQNAGQIVLQGSDLDAFSDDPEDLSNELQMLAGPAQGPNGGQIYIDGFSDGVMPPKASIRDIRVNQNPFSAEYDRVGFGRVDVRTKPGSDKYHGQLSFDFGNRALTARNPYLAGPTVPDYQQDFISGNFGGPLSKKASFFIDSDIRVTDENALVNYTALDMNLNPININTALLTPSRRYSASPRIDYALTANNTLSLRYSWVATHADNQGINVQQFDLPSQAYGLDSGQQSIQLADSAILGAKILNDARFQFLRTQITQQGVSSAPEVYVQGAFTGGGTFPENYTHDNKSEFQDNVTLVRGSHTVQFGVRLRDEELKQQSTSNFNGRFIFSSTPELPAAIDVYRENQLLTAAGDSPAQITALGYGPSEFLLTTGSPVATVQVFDAGLYIQDDWRLRPNLSISAGLRYEGQSGIPDHADFAPRVGLAWAPKAGGGKTPKTVIRAGGGIFYDRFTSALLMNATLYNGINQTQYLVHDPNFYPNVPDFASVAAISAAQGATQVRYQIEPSLHAPYVIQAAVGLERQLTRGISAAVNYTNTRGLRQLVTEDINAPLPTAFNSLGEASGPRPFGSAGGDIYQYESAGVFKENQLIVTVTAKTGRKLSWFGYYVYNHAMSDTDGPGSMPSSAYNLDADYGRAAFDYRHRAFVSASSTLPLGIRLAPFIFLQSGLPYNVTTGVDTNGDGNPNDDRPAFAQDLSRLSVVTTPFGAFDTEPGTLPNLAIVPRNYLEGPGIMTLSIRVSRSWSFGTARSGRGNTGSSEIRGGEAIQNSGLSGNSSQTGLASVTGGVETAKKYNLTMTASIRNALNNVNPATPIGNLSSPFFGRSVALNTFGPLPGAGPNAGAGNRRIELQLRLTF